MPVRPRPLDQKVLLLDQRFPLSFQPLSAIGRQGGRALRDQLREAVSDPPQRGPSRLRDPVLSPQITFEKQGVWDI